jgi:CBS domain containing-hemolysin-like protein
MFLLIFYIVLTITVSFFCSMMEASLLSITPPYIAALEHENPRLGARVRALREDVDRPLSAILSLNTIANVVGASGVGVQTHLIFGESGVAISSGFLTLGILFMAEIIPKSLGANYWRKLTPFVARAVPVMIVMVFPLVFMSRLLTRMLNSGDVRPTLSREEFTALATKVADEGVLHAQESLVLRNLGKFGSLRAKDIMTPRTVIVGFDEELTVDEAVEINDLNLRFSRFPIWEDEVDEITGYVLKHDLMLYYARDQGQIKLKDIKRPIDVLPFTAPVSKVLDAMLKKREHMILLVGEYGGTAGVVTMEDVVETMLGMEILDESDEVEDMQMFARQQWRRRAESLGIVHESEVEDVAPDEPDDA